MKRFVYGVAALALIVAFAGCTKKQQALEEMQQPMAPEDLSRLKTEAQPAATTPAATAPVQAAQETVSAPAASEEPLAKLPPAGPYKPSNQEIQTALKNAGFYTGAVDGKLGPMSKKAIEEFQKANNLNPDGKIGPKTWTLLEKYLNPPAAVTSASAPVSKKKR